MRKRIIFFIPVLVFIGILILFQTVFFIGYVPSASMEPTIREKSIIFGLRVFGDLSIGDIIVFEHDGNVMVKRIAAVGGDAIEMNGRSYDVPQRCYFVLGDNDENSWDSRFWEYPFVAQESIIARL